MKLFIMCNFQQLCFGPLLVSMLSANFMIFSLMVNKHS